MDNKSTFARKIKKAFLSPKASFFFLKRYLQRYTDYHFYIKDDVSYPPKIVFINPTGRCNLFCRMCDIGQARKQEAVKKRSSLYRNIVKSEELPIEQYKKLFKEFKTFKPHVSISGGEPLLYKDLKTILELADKHGILTSMVTNGLLLEKNAEMLINSNLYELKISIDGLGKTFDTLRGLDGLFEKVTSGLKKILELKKAKKSSTRIVLNYTITPENLLNMVSFVDCFHKYDINDITFFHMFYKTNEMVKEYYTNYPQYCKNYSISDSAVSCFLPNKIDIKVLVKNIEEIKAKYKNQKIYFSPDMSMEKLRIYYNNPECFINRKECIIPWLSTGINSNGDVIVSSICFNHVMGNIRESNLLDIWNGEEYRKFRRILKQENAFSVCSRCCNIFNQI